MLGWSSCPRIQPPKVLSYLPPELRCASSMGLTDLWLRGPSKGDTQEALRGQALPRYPLGATAPRIGRHGRLPALTQTCFCNLHRLMSPGFLAQNRETEEVSLPWELSARSKEKKERQEKGTTTDCILFHARFCPPHCLHYLQNP